jgi:hypothetical protein
MVNGWKVTAIILLILVALETSLIVWAYNAGTDAINKEYECSNDVCFNQDSSSYTYDDSTKTCYCYDDLGEVSYQKVLK